MCLILSEINEQFHKLDCKGFWTVFVATILTWYILNFDKYKGFYIPYDNDEFKKKTGIFGVEHALYRYLNLI